MALRLFNTLSAKVEEFRPLVGNEVRMYACGPTVYDYGHIGNFRTFIAVDILRRYLQLGGYKVKHVMNITDVDDKIIRNAAAAGLTVQQYTAKYQKAFFEDAGALRIEQPQIVRATENFAKKISPVWKTALASMSMNTKRTMPAISHYGKHLSPERLHGTA